jgi:tRNA U34 5-methylaminomethyl-2-thiouridine-forming methyltransferase MnmC
MDRRVVHAAAEELQPPLDALLPWNAILSQLHRHPTWQQERIHLAIHWGDARFTLRHIPPHSQDLVFLDAFSTQRNSELWTVDFFREIRNRMKPDGALLTYCAAIPVRAGLLEAGFHVGETRPVGRPRGGTIATINPDLVPHPLPKRDQHLIATSHRGIPYRDPDLSCTNKEILRARQQAILAARRT